MGKPVKKGQLEAEEKEEIMINRRFLRWAERQGSTVEGRIDFAQENDTSPQ